MTLTNATGLNDQVDILSPNRPSFAEQTLNSIFNASPKNADTDDDDLDNEDDIDDTDEVLYDEDDLDDDDEVSTYADADELDTIDDDDDAGIIDDDDLDSDDDKGSVTSGLNGSSSFADRPQGRTTGRMIDHEPGSPSNL